jgi:hypothetical protein
MEVGLEVRAYRRGYATLIFGQREVVATQQDRSETDPWGPSEEFPFRSVIVDPVKPPGVIRIWIASASQAEDPRMPPDLIFPSLLEEYLEDRGIRAQILNAGKVGLATASNQAALELRGGIWQPDIVVLYSMQAGTPDGDKPSGKEVDQQGSQVPQANMPRSGQKAPSGLDRVIENFTLYDLLKTNITPMLVAEKQLPDRVAEGEIDGFEAAVDSFVGTVEALGARPVLSTIAISHETHNLAEMPADYRLNRLRFDPSVSVAGWVESVARLNDRLSVYAKQNDLPLVPLAENVGGRPKYFRDPVHFTPAGHAEVARVLADYLAQQPALNDLTASQ